MKKILWALCLVLAISFCSFVGCNKATEKTDDSSPRQSENNTDGDGVELPDVEL